MENFNSEQFAHLNPDTECAAFEQVWSYMFDVLSSFPALRAS